MIPELFNIKSYFKEHKIYFCYSGPFSQDLLSQISLAVKSKLSDMEVALPVVSKIFSVSIEQSQNIVHYAAEKDLDSVLMKETSEFSFGIIVIGHQKEKGYFIASGNLIRNHEVLALQQRLDMIASKDKEALKQLYLERRRGKVLKPGDTAGLGLILMAREASFGLEHEFRKLDHEHSFFSIKVII